MGVDLLMQYGIIYWLRTLILLVQTSGTSSEDTKVQNVSELLNKLQEHARFVFVVFIVLIFIIELTAGTVNEIYDRICEDPACRKSHFLVPQVENR